MPEEGNTSQAIESTTLPSLPVAQLDSLPVMTTTSTDVTSVADSASADLASMPPQPEDRNPPSENFDLADDSFIKEDPAGDDADSIGPDHHESWSAAKGEGEVYDDKDDF